MSVSILIPAFKARYLRESIASALCQSVEGFEIIISDDSIEDEVKDTVALFNDRRIKYVRTSGRTGGANNCRFLWDHAQHDLIQYLFDDDVLMPYSAAELLGQARKHPDASMYFGTRYVIDSHGRITGEPPARDKPELIVDAGMMARSLFPRLQNPVGELNNVMLNRNSGLRANIANQYLDHPINMLTDVAIYLEATSQSYAVGIARPVAGFRIHGQQNSSPAANPRFALGICEWELFLRGERDKGTLDQNTARQAATKLKATYDGWMGKYPFLAEMRGGLADFTDPTSKERFIDEAFLGRWTRLLEAVRA